LKIIVQITTAILVLLAFAALHLPTFYAVELHVQGHRYALDDELERFSGFVPGNVFRMNFIAMQRSVVRHPWVDDAFVVWDWPNELTLEIKERTPHALVSHGGTWLLVDEQGYRLPLPRNEPVPVLPIITAVDANDKGRLGRAAASLQAMPETLAERVSEYNGQRQLLVMEQGTIVRLGDLTDIERKYQVLAAILEDLESGPEEDTPIPRSIDLRSPTAPVVAFE